MDSDGLKSLSQHTVHSYAYYQSIDLFALAFRKVEFPNNVEFTFGFDRYNRYEETKLKTRSCFLVRKDNQM